MLSLLIRVQKARGLMARRLKTYQTSSGFFDLAVAAPSMKAAAEAWGSRTNLFDQGLAKETHDPRIVAATMAKPGVVLRRPVGSKVAFTEHPELPQHFPLEEEKERSAKHRSKAGERQVPKADRVALRNAAAAFDREQKRREAKRKKEEAAREREHKRREQKLAKAERALEQAEREHKANVRKIEDSRDQMERRAQAEEARWEKQKERLENALRQIRD